jgi:hypothetical protein
MCCAEERAKHESAKAKRRTERTALPPPDTRPRFDNGIYRDCPHCKGDGCDKCPEEADAEYKRQFPDGPVPIFTARRDNPRDMELLKFVAGCEALEEAFGPDGRGMEEIEDRARAAKWIQENPNQC